MDVKMFCLILLFLWGCNTIEEAYYSKGTAGYNYAIEHLQKSEDGRKYLAQNLQPRIVTVADDGSIYVYPEDRYGYEKFSVHGKSFSGTDFLSHGVPDIVYKGWEEHSRLKDIDDAEEERRRLLAVDNAIKNPRKISQEEFLGVKPKENMKPRLCSKFPRIYGNKEFYSYNFANDSWVNLPYHQQILVGHETVDKLKIPHGFILYEVMIDHSTGWFCDYDSSGRQISADGNYEKELTAVLNDVKAFLHTDVNPEFSEWVSTDHGIMRRWSWKGFETVEHQFFNVDVCASANESNHPKAKGYWSLRFRVHATDDPKKIAQKRAAREQEDKEKRLAMEEYNALVHRLSGPMRDLYNRVKNQLAIVKTEKCGGSGFLVKDDSGVYVYTNEHVIRGSSEMPIFETITGKTLHLGDFELAKGRDLVRFKVLGAVTDGLPLTLKEPNIGTDITVFGNSDGADVATALSGSVIGVGPKLIEISAEFVQGNSGSPVMTLDGIVVGVATFAVNAADNENWMKKDTRFNGVRRFAYRVDNVQWKKMDWDLYSTIINR